MVRKLGVHEVSVTTRMHNFLTFLVANLVLVVGNFDTVIGKFTKMVPNFVSPEWC
jgi:hypothetical protein